MFLYTLESKVILPFRSLIAPIDVTGKIPGEDWETQFSLFYSEKAEIIQNCHIDINFCPIINIKTKQKHNGNLEEARKWVKNNFRKIIYNRIINSINYFLLLIKRYKPSCYHTGVIRNVGEIDLIFYNLIFENEVVWARGTSTIFDELYSKKEKIDVNIDISVKPPTEWCAITRAVDLINHGYFSEALIIAFALLDDLTQKFVKENLPNLNDEQAKELLRRIESRRLETYLGNLLRIILSKSPLDNKSMNKDLIWLNKKRNCIMHSGIDITWEESKRGLQIVIDILSFLKDHGAKYTLPNRLKFW